MTRPPLSRLMTDGCDGNLPVALRQGEPVSFAAFRAAVAGAAAAFSGCRSAALICNDSCSFAVGLLGLLHAGAKVVLPANRQAASLEALRGCFEQLVDDDAIAHLPQSSEVLKPIAADRAELILITSGTTGRPKPVSRSLALFERELTAIDALWGGRGWRGPVLATVSHQHLFGLTFKILWPLSAGLAFDAGTHEVWESLLAVLSPEAILVASPAHLSRLGGIVPLASSDWPAAIFTAGAPLTAAAAAAALRILGRLPTEIFGSTETGAFATRQQEVGGEAWQLFPGVEIRTDGESRLAVAAPYVADWVETGDRIEPRPGGFRFRGRADRVVKIEGKRVSLVEVEDALGSLELVELAAVVGLPTEPMRLVAALVLSELGRQRLGEIGPFRLGRLLRRQLEPVLEPAARPRAWRFLARLPEGALGKRRDADIAALFARVT